ncbi:hypothetical protein KRR39_10625 [Nocardioides panacis]|uniref:Endonuclease/exonuclease/phosphatase domain-containing protein n=1 Tax=Nocardioides panacis TaxID=2849501 RepID=A0A975Y265_9ACTN|nr:hypothetical protein [Nocardioides panacis]QWZ10144.1 hypothetical protein KRR39_10625 [Nocardioides panacis]
MASGPERTRGRIELLDRHAVDIAETLTIPKLHNPADTRRYPRQGAWRTMAVNREVDAVRRLHAIGQPGVITGDMNDQDDVLPVHLGSPDSSELRAE